MKKMMLGKIEGISDPNLEYEGIEINCNDDEDDANDESPVIVKTNA
jgi:hypothetical protein